MKRLSGIQAPAVAGVVREETSTRAIAEIKNCIYDGADMIFVHIGKRMRGPAGREVGKIKNVTLENITADGPYEEYEIMPRNYFSFKDNDTLQNPWIFGVEESFDDTHSETQQKVIGR